MCAWVETTLESTLTSSPLASSRAEEVSSQEVSMPRMREAFIYLRYLSLALTRAFSSSSSLRLRKVR